MIAELFQPLQSWGTLDTWIVVTAALAAMACALPGNYLLLRRQSMMGDALSHTALLGVVAAFLISHRLLTAGWIGADTYDATRHLAMFIGAVIIGVLTALLTEAIEKLGGVESSAALGVVFTSLFALGLVLIRVAADSVHLDLDCVFYGTIENAAYPVRGGIPPAALINGVMLLVNLALVLVFSKELKLTAFDPGLATTLGLSASLVNYLLMAVTAATLVAAFESVGSILVIAMLIAPPATAFLLSSRLSRMIALSLVVAALAAVLGHVMAITLPAFVFSRLGFSEVTDASTAGMMAVACGFLFAFAMLLAPRTGIVSQLVRRWQLGVRVAGEDLLGALYRREESSQAFEAPGPIAPLAGVGPILSIIARRRLAWKGWIRSNRSGLFLTDAGRDQARQLIRAHRLWESYMARHFAVPDDHLHRAAERIEHYLDPALRDELAADLDQPTADPQGKAIPPEHDAGRG